MPIDPQSAAAPDVAAYPPETAESVAATTQNQGIDASVIKDFLGWDRNGDGEITIDDADPDTLQKLAESIRQMDLDGDGKVTLAEFDRTKAALRRFVAEETARGNNGLGRSGSNKAAWETIRQYALEDERPGQ